MEITKKSLMVSFTAANGKTLSIEVSNPKEGMAPSIIKKAMEDVLASNALGNESVATALAEAKYVIQQVDQVDIA